MKQHFEPVRQRQSRNVGVEMRIALCEILKRREELLIQHQPITAGMGGNDSSAFLQRQLKSIGIADGLIFSDQAELISDMAEKRQLPIRERSVKRFVARISRVELLRVRKRLHQYGSGIGAAMNFFDGVLSLRINRDAGEELIRVSPGGLQHIIVADQKIRVCLIEPAVLIVDPIHTEEYGLLNMMRGAQFGKQIVEVLTIGFLWVRGRQFVLPQKEAKQRTLQHLRRDVAAVVAVRQSCQMYVTVDQGFFDHRAPLIIGDISLLSPYPSSLTSFARCSMAIRFRLRRSIFPVPSIGRASTLMKFPRDGMYR